MNTRNAELINAAIEAGINYIDTAHGYMRGENEKIVGSVVKNKRDKVFLTTKVHAREKTPKEIREMMELSLQRLQTDYVDCMLSHMPSTREDVLIEEHLKTFEQAKKDGICRFIGVSTHRNQAEIIDAAVETKLFDAVLVGYNVTSPADLRPAIERARNAGLATIAMKTQVKGTGYTDHDMGNITPNQAALKWVLQDRFVDTTIPGMTAFEHLTEDLSVMGMSLSFNDRRELQRFGQSLEGTYCRGVAGCTGCTGQCPKGVDICELNRCLGYAYGYGDRELAQENYDALPSSCHVEVCSDCEKCLVKCVNGLDLTQSVFRARELFA
jgi:predicted aldo/keto reductase-like oxidoreductase